MSAPLSDPAPQATVDVAFAVLDRMMPMHAVVSATGHIVHAGPTLAKLSPETGFIGARFLEAFEVRRPRAAKLIGDLRHPAGVRLTLRMRDLADIRLKGIAMPLPQEGLLVNLSFGISVPDAIRQLGLSAGDFSPTDLAIEMLYLVEAKEAVTAESRNLNMRLLWAKSEAEEQAYTDTLTGLKNRRAMDMILARYRSCAEQFSLMHMDLDHFKAVNDTLGHAAGDAVLVKVAEVLTAETRNEDAVIRVGGDEFVILFNRLAEPHALARISERILAQLERPIPYDGQECQISGSIGITISEDYAEINPEQMLIDADVALYAAKKAGRARYVFVRDVGGVGQSASVLSAAAALPRAS